MSTLAFFPWLALDNDIDLPNFSLMRYERGLAPGGAVQPTLDAVLELYIAGGDRPIRKATLFKLPNKGLTVALSDDDRNNLFVHAELIAFAGLAKREYFGQSRYTNRDTFAFYVQEFSDPVSGVAVMSRRRDGSTFAYKTRGVARQRQPDHVVGNRGDALGACPSNRTDKEIFRCRRS